MIRNNIVLDEAAFGPLWQFINDDSITDVDINDGVVWTRDVHMRRENTGMVLDAAFTTFFTNRVANIVSGSLNPVTPILEAEAPSLRFSILHESVTMTGRSICIRKTPAWIRLTPEHAVKEKFMDKDTMHFLANCVKAQMTVIACGEVGVGKTEALKFLTRYIGEKERIATIEDSAELHYEEIYPNRDCVSMIVNSNFMYSEAIKSALRQDVSRIILSEARSSEAKDLIECLSSGMSGMSTVHTDDVRNIPSRFLNMMPSRNDADRLSNDVYTYLDIGILLRAKKLPDGTKYRYIDQVGIYTESPNDCSLIVKNGCFQKGMELPEKIIEKFSAADIKNPFEYEEGFQLHEGGNV